MRSCFLVASTLHCFSMGYKQGYCNVTLCSPASLVSRPGEVVILNTRAVIGAGGGGGGW